MTVFNILDQRRNNEYNPNIDVVYEIFEVKGISDELPNGSDTYTEWQARTTVAEAIEVADKFVGSVTLFFYDPGWVITNYNRIVIIHPKIKRDVLIPGQMNLDFNDARNNND